MCTLHFKYEPMNQNESLLHGNISLVNLHYLNNFQHTIKVNPIMLFFKLVEHNFMFIYSNTYTVRNRHSP